jgi:hypothetical protein
MRNLSDRLRAYAKGQGVRWTPITPGGCAYNWSHARHIFENQATWDRAAALQARYRRYLATMDARRNWVEVRRIAWADGSVESIERADDGAERTVTLVAPHGDLC